MILKRKIVESIYTSKRPHAKVLTAAPILKMEIGSFYIPKDNPSRPLGEDAHFVYSQKQAAGVADGVGGWASKGIDAGEYARELMRNCVVSIAGGGGSSVDNPKRVLAEAHSRTKAGGSSTACIISLDGEFLRATNLGDSGFMIFRNKQFLYQSPVQRRGFNCPYQMGNGESCEKPEAAWRARIRMEAGDVIVVGTDGLLDNMFAKEIEEVLAEERGDRVEAGKLARRLAELALHNSFDKWADSPFAAEARRAGRSHRGGKIDDITVIVGKVRASAD